jgi:quercetin dioxygenase-like cupin family protein
VHFRDLGHARFAANYAQQRTPLIITGFEDGLAKPYWSFERVHEVCGHLTVPVRAHSSDRAPTTWAALRERGTSSLATLLDTLMAGSEADGFLFDWSLRSSAAGCVALLDGFGVPSYFTADTVAAFGPALFAQANGTRCGLHVDSHASHFWQFLWSGRKRWRVLAPADWARLESDAAWRQQHFPDLRCSPLFGAATDAVCDVAGHPGASSVDAFDDDALRELAALAGPMRVLEGTLTAGELLFIPANAPHQVLNEATSVAVTMNYVDATNADEAAHAHLADHGVHPKFRSRLRKGGVDVAGSKTRWYERFRMPWEREEDRRRRLVAKLVRHDEPRADDAFVEQWEHFARRWWNLNLTQHPDY